jgi:EmrB/QacA subfamily drug resistance transporter
MLSAIRACPRPDMRFAPFASRRRGGSQTRVGAVHERDEGPARAFAERPYDRNTGVPLHPARPFRIPGPGNDGRTGAGPQLEVTMTSEPSPPSPSFPSGQPAYLQGRDLRIVLVGVMLALFLAALDQTVIVTALPTIAEDLGDGAYLSWVVTAYLLTATATAPLYGKFADIRGRRVALFLALGVFTAGSIACALSPTMLTLILARAVQGLGAGGLMAVPMTIVADAIPARDRGRYQGYITSVYAVSSLAGPVIGGTLTDFFDWTLIFWINLPLAALTVAIGWPALRRLPRNERRHSLDGLGAVLLIAATVAMLLPLTWSGNSRGWLSATTVLLFATALVLWVLFVIRLRLTPEPLVPISILRNPVVATGALGAFFSTGTFIGLTVVTPLLFETLRGYSPSQSGLAVIPLMIGAVVGATISGQGMYHLLRYKRVAIAGLGWAVAGSALMAVWFEQMSGLTLSLALGLVSLGIGTALPVTVVSIQNAVEPHQMGTATAASTFFRQFGGAIMAAIFGAILLTQAGQGASIEDLGAHVDDPVGLIAAFRWIFAIAAVTLGLALFSLIKLEERPLRGRS